MPYKYNAFAHRLKSCEPLQAYRPEGLSNAMAKGSKIYFSGAGQGYNILTSLVYRPNRTLAFQKLMQSSNRLVFLARGPADKVIYMGLMTVAVIGLGCALTNIGLVATNKKKRMPRSS